MKKEEGNFSLAPVLASTAGILGSIKFFVQTKNGKKPTKFMYYLVLVIFVMSLLMGGIYAYKKVLK